MDQDSPMSEVFGSNTRKSEGGGTRPMEEGRGRLESQPDQGQGQVGSSEMIASVGPDEMGKSLIEEELDCIPDQPERQLVKTFKAPLPKVVISKVFNLKELLENIDKCGRYRYIVVNATADKASVLIKTQNALFDVLKLCDAVSLIVQNFQSGASNILEKLRVACLYLQDGFPDFAMADIESTSKDVAMMRERCGKTLEKVPGDNLPSMDTYVTNDFKQRRSDLPEGIVMDDSFVVQRSTEVIGELADEESAKESNDMTVAVGKQRTCSRPSSGTTEDENLSSFVAIQEESLDYQSSGGFITSGYTSMFSSAATSLTGQEADSSEMHDSFVASDDMQKSFEAIQEGSNEIDELGRRVDEDKAKQLKVMTDAVDDRLEQLQSDTPEDETTVYTSDEGMGISMVYVPPIEKVLEMMAEDEFKRHYYPIALMLRAINFGWMEVKDRYIIIVYKYLGYKEPLTITSAKDRESKSSDAENSPISVAERQVPDPDVLDKIDSYMRAKLTSVIVEIVKELYNSIRKLIKDALDLTEKWYQECKTLVEPAMKFNLEKTQGMTKEEQKKFWQTCDPDFANKAEAYLERWRQLHEHCDSHRKDIRKLRQTIEGYYIDNPYPREAVKASWKLAAKEQERRIRNVVEEWRSYMPSAEVDGAE